MTIPEQFTHAPQPGGWPPPEQWQQYPYQQAGPSVPPSPWPPPSPSRKRHGGRIAAAVGGGVAALVLAGAGGFAAGWSLHSGPGSVSNSGYSSPYLPLNPDNSGGGSGSGSGSDGGGLGSGSSSGGGLGSDGGGLGSNGGGLGSGGGGLGAGGGPGSGSGSGSGSDNSGAGGPSAGQIAAVAAKVDPALVDIVSVLGAQNAEAAGTGIVIGSDGIVLTNNHVVAGATSITVTDIGNHQNYRAAVLGYDRTGDLAVLKLSGASGLATATLASTPATAGQQVVAIGNAGGTGGTPSAVGGVVTALGQSITASDESTGASEKLTGLIEVNAGIQAGDSGGPLLTTSGQVLGVDTAASAGFRYQASGGDGYAIPIGTATTVADQIRAGKSSGVVHIGETAYLGIETSGSGYAGESGPAVLGVVRGSPAESAGLTRGDVIQSVAGTTVGDATALTDLLDRYHPGDKVKVHWTDVSGQSHTATVKLATGPVG